MKKYIITGIVCLIVGAIAGFILAPRQNVSYTVQGISSPGATNSSAKEYTVTMAPLLAAGTTTSLLNTDGTDRFIKDSFAACTGVGTSNAYLTGTGGIAALLVQMSTSTVGSTGLQGNTNYASSITISTTTPWAYTSTSTLAATGVAGLIWPSGTYLNITFNATNTAACTVGARTVNL